MGSGPAPSGASRNDVAGLSDGSIQLEKAQKKWTGFRRSITQTHKRNADTNAIQNFFYSKRVEKLTEVRKASPHSSQLQK
jgi:uncharacterized protein YecT (DUF1311 family)